MAMDVSGIDNVLAQLRASSAMAAGSAGSVTTTIGAGATTGIDFGQMLKAALDQTNGAQQQAGKLAREFEMGAPNANLHEVMISLKKANISFQEMVQVRNKLVSAYNDIMSMQI